MSTPQAEKASVEELARRMASISSLLALAARIPLPTLGQVQPRRIVTTGIGASEGPARLLASTLLDSGVAAQFVPLASFAMAAPAGDLLVMFSQNLSPNARLALTAQHAFKARWLVTSLGFTAADAAADNPINHETSAPSGAVERLRFLQTLRSQGVVPIVAPPASEDGMLVRVVGPTVASLIALRLAHVLGAETLAHVPFEAAAEAYASPVSMQPLPSIPCALIAAGVSIESVHGQRWKLLETLLRGDPPVWDVLQVAHGPLQWFHEQPMLLLALATTSSTALLDRLEAILSPARHRLVRIVATRSDVLACFEHAAAIDACVLATLRQAPRDLFDWPGRGADGALYRLGEA